MNAVIVHDSKFGNGKFLAERMGEVFQDTMKVTISHVKEISPEEVLEKEPTILIIGTAVRMFILSWTSRRWVRKMKKVSKFSSHQISYGAVFVTHGLQKERVEGRANRFLKLFKSVPNIKIVHPFWLSGRVIEAEGPLEEGVESFFVEEAKKMLKQIVENT